jgi:hypothetical protein
VDEEYAGLLMSLVVNGYSESQIIRSLKELGLPFLHLLWLRESGFIAEDIQ